MAKGMPQVDWQRFYTALDKCTLSIEKPDPADPHRLHRISDQLAQVSKLRNAIDKIRRKLDLQLGSLRNDIEIVTERLRLERAEYRQDPESFIGCKNRDDREAALDLLTRTTSARLAIMRGMVRQYEHAKQSVEATSLSLTTAKETLNGMRQIFTSEMENL